MNNSGHRGIVYAIPTFLIILIVTIAVWSFTRPTVNAGSPPPDVPNFEGEPFSAVFPQPELLTQTTIAEPAIKSDWTILLEDGFESGISPLTWINLSAGSSGDYKWETRDVTNALDANSVKSAWCVGGGQDGGGLTPPGYPPNVESWLVSGPYSMENALEAKLTFQSSFDADDGDIFGVAVSTDGNSFNGLQASSGGGGGWNAAGFDLNNYLNEEQLWIGFWFKSDATGSNSKSGAFVDNVVLQARYASEVKLPYIVYGPSPTPLPPTPTPTPPPNQDYRDDFTSTIEPWSERIWTAGATYDLSHRSDSDGGYSGFLQLKVNNPAAYVLVSPLAQSRSIPYNVQTRAVFKDAKSGQSYSIIFGGDWNGQACPQPSFASCFNVYYEMRVQYEDNNGNPYLNMKFKRIDGHDSNNQSFGPDLIEWTKVKKGGWIKWDVTVHEDGKICIAANKDPVANCVYDSTYLSNPFFGLTVRNSDQGNARVKFDYYQIDWPDDIAEQYEGVPAVRYTEETMPPATTD